MIHRIRMLCPMCKAVNQFIYKEKDHLKCTVCGFAGFYNKEIDCYCAMIFIPQAIIGKIVDEQ